MHKLMMLGLAGAVGTLARYGLVSLVGRTVGTSYAWGTLVVNVAGCFLVGAVFALFDDRWQVSQQTRVVVLVGFIGAFTTFSAFILDTEMLTRSSGWGFAVSNLALQNGLGFIALIAGAAVGRWV